MREFPNYFADADEDFNSAKFVLFGVPFDKTSSFRFGAKDAPREIRIASWNFESFHLETGTNLSKIPIHDYGDLEVQDKTSEEMMDEVKRFVNKVSDENKIPIAMGGEHSITTGVIRGLKKENLGVIFLDAHLDFRNSYEGTPHNHACSLRRVADVIGVSNVISIGVRSADEGEYRDAEKMNLKFFTAREVWKGGIDKVIETALKELNQERIYLSIDIDVIDPAFAPGVSTPEPFGIEPLDVVYVIKRVAPRLVGMDVVEVCPKYDNGITALLAAKLIRIGIDEVWRNNYI
ncbi:MAG TPA: agmatinase [Thermoplasmatales archaeon]|nr:agmatinase [Thermoplasmatales archaeon]